MTTRVETTTTTIVHGGCGGGGGPPSASSSGRAPPFCSSEAAAAVLQEQVSEGARLRDSLLKQSRNLNRIRDFLLLYFPCQWDFASLPRAQNVPSRFGNFYCIDDCNHVV